MESFDADSPWFAVNVRSNQEKIAEGLLREKGYATFCPLQRKRSRRRDKVLDLELPLFPGYLFCQFAPHNRGPIVTLTPVVRVIGIGKTPVAVDQSELSAVRAIVDSGVPYTPWPHLGVGESVRVVAGPLAGLTGILTGERGADRVVVNVGLIHRAVAAEVQRSWITPVRARKDVAAISVRAAAASAAGS